MIFGSISFERGGDARWRDSGKRGGGVKERKSLYLNEVRKEAKTNVCGRGGDVPLYSQKDRSFGNMFLR